MNEHTKEVVIVALMTVACLVATWLDASQLAAMLGGAACALVVPRAGTVARSGVVIGAVVLASTVSGCGSTPVPARAACRGVVQLMAAVCEHVPVTVGEETP